MDYEALISEKFPNCEVEVIGPDFLEIDKLVEYITDDIIVFNPHAVMVYSHLIRFLVNVGKKGKIYYLEGFSQDDLEVIYAGLLKFTWKMDTKINLFKNADPDKEVLGLD